MSKSFVSIKIAPTEYKYFEVPKEVQLYIMQLEAALRDGNEGKQRMSKLYPERFT